MSINGVPIGLKDVHYALLTSDASGGAVYATPVKMVGAITANINPNSSIETLFADDGPMEVATVLGNIEVELNMADLPLEVQAILLGHGTLSGGVMMAGSEDSPPWLGIGFKSLKSNGKYRYTWLLKGKFREPENNSETKNDSVNFQTSTIVGNFTIREYDSKWKKQTDEDATGFVEDTATAWFTDGPDAP